MSGYESEKKSVNALQSVGTGTSMFPMGTEQIERKGFPMSASVNQGYYQVTVDRWVVCQFDNYEDARHVGILIEQQWTAAMSLDRTPSNWDVDERFSIGGAEGMPGGYWRSILKQNHGKAPRVVIEVGEFEADNRNTPAPPRHYIERIERALRLAAAEMYR